MFALLAGFFAYYIINGLLEPHKWPSE